MRERRATRWRSLCRTMARLRLRLRRTGKGWPWSTASGVSTGHTSRLKCACKNPFCSGLSWAGDRMTTPAFADSSGAICSRKLRYKAATMSWTRAPIATSCSLGNIPSAPLSATPPASNCFKPATRTMKNSSRLDATMPWNLQRSARGTAGSHASSKTRPLNSNQDSSRLMKWCGRTSVSAPTGAWLAAEEERLEDKAIISAPRWGHLL